MKKTLIHTAIYLLTATVLFASTGVSVHQFYCYCLGEMTASIFKPDDLCDSESVPECCKVKSADQSKQCEDDGDCSDCTSKYVHLDTDFLLLSADFKLDIPQMIYSSDYVAKTHLVCGKLGLFWENDLPPPPYGKSLLPHIQSYLC